MSKIEEYKTAKRLADEARTFADGVNPNQPRDSRHYIDKLGADFRATKTWKGQYGDSSSYSWPDKIKAEIERQIDIELRSLIEHTALRLEKEAEDKRLAAQDEAREVLAETEARQ